MRAWEQIFSSYLKNVIKSESKGKLTSTARKHTHTFSCLHSNFHEKISLELAVNNHFLELLNCNSDGEFGKYILVLGSQFAFPKCVLTRLHVQDAFSIYVCIYA